MFLNINPKGLCLIRHPLVSFLAVIFAVGCQSFSPSMETYFNNSVINHV